MTKLTNRKASNQKAATTKPGWSVEKTLVSAYPVLIGVLLIIVYRFAFDRKLSLNGDNGAYYLIGKSILHGFGYSVFSDVNHAPETHFPPGYPLIITGMMTLFPDSIVAIKVLNGVFLGAALILSLSIFRRIGASSHIAFLSCIFLMLTTGVTLVDTQDLSINASLLTSSTIMMSETPFLFFASLALYAFLRLDERLRRREPAPFTVSVLLKPLRSPLFYLCLFSLSYAFHIRTAGIALFGFVVVYWLYHRRWDYLFVTGAGYTLLALPWLIRGQSLGGSSYIKELFYINPYRPELGQAHLSDLVLRFYVNLLRYITKEIPVGTLPVKITYEVTTAGDWLLSLTVLTVAVVGAWRLNRAFLGSYFLCLFAVLLVWPDVWTGARFLLPGVPLLILCLTQGVHTVVTHVAKQIRLPFKPHPLILTVCVLLYIPNLRLVTLAARSPYPPEWQTYLEIAKWAETNTPADAVIACRSPYLFALMANRHTTFFANNLDDKEMLRSLEDAKVTHVVLDQLGFSATTRYLYPAIQKNPERFTPIYDHTNPRKNLHQYLLKFNKSGKTKP